jgi:hypothetical protein
MRQPNARISANQIDQPMQNGTKRKARRAIRAACRRAATSAPERAAHPRTDLMEDPHIASHFKTMNTRKSKNTSGMPITV